VAFLVLLAFDLDIAWSSSAGWGDSSIFPSHLAHSACVGDSPRPRDDASWKRQQENASCHIPIPHASSTSIAIWSNLAKIHPYYFWWLALLSGVIMTVPLLEAAVATFAFINTASFSPTSPPTGSPLLPARGRVLLCYININVHALIARRGHGAPDRPGFGSRWGRARRAPHKHWTPRCVAPWRRRLNLAPSLMHVYFGSAGLTGLTPDRT
jgi:hypothetical protein